MALQIKELIPPVLIKYLRFTKEYSSFNEANEKCSNVNYQNETLCNVVAEKTKIYAGKLNTKPYELSATNVFLVTAISNYLNLIKTHQIKIVDYGGACGVHYFEARRFFPENIKLNWTIIETPQMVLSAKAQGLENPELKFTNDLNSIEEPIDLLYSSCALHYVVHPYDELEKLINKKAKWLFFNRMMFNRNNRDLFTVQKSSLSSNGPGPLPTGLTDATIYYPHTTLSYINFLNQLLPHYNLIWKFEEKTGVHPVNREDVFGEGLLFELK